MSKKNNLKDFLADLYQGIVSKKPGASRNPQRFRAEIESIKTSGNVVIGGGGMVLGDITPSIDIVQPKKYFLKSIPLTASIAVNEIQNLSVTKGE